MAGLLELKWEPDGPRNYLDGLPVHAGDTIEVLSNDGLWKPAQYENRWNPRTNDFQAFLIVSGDALNQGEFLVPEITTCRWPKKLGALN